MQLGHRYMDYKCHTICIYRNTETDRFDIDVMHDDDLVISREGYRFVNDGIQEVKHLVDLRVRFMEERAVA